MSFDERASKNFAKFEIDKVLLKTTSHIVRASAVCILPHLQGAFIPVSSPAPCLAAESQVVHIR